VYWQLAKGRSKETPSDSDREIDRFLRFSEPPEYDEWESTENLREQYQRGFRTKALDEHVPERCATGYVAISKGSGGDSLGQRSEQVSHSRGGV